MPIAVPMMPHSDSGVSKQRFSPNSSNRPAVAPNTPPFLPTSSPNTITRSSLRISVRIASVIASSIVITFVPVLPSPAFVCVAVMGMSGGDALRDAEAHSGKAPTSAPTPPLATRSRSRSRCSFSCGVRFM